jgi:hypothetical protein
VKRKPKFWVGQVVVELRDQHKLPRRITRIIGGDCYDLIPDNGDLLGDALHESELRPLTKREIGPHKAG